MIFQRYAYNALIKVTSCKSFYLSLELKDRKQTIRVISKYRKLLMMLFITEELAEQMTPRRYISLDDGWKNYVCLLCRFLLFIHRSTNIFLTT